MISKEELARNLLGRDAREGELQVHPGKLQVEANSPDTFNEIAQRRELRIIKKGFQNLLWYGVTIEGAGGWTITLPNHHTGTFIDKYRRNYDIA